MFIDVAVYARHVHCVATTCSIIIEIIYMATKAKASWHLDGFIGNLF